MRFPGLGPRMIAVGEDAARKPGLLGGFAQQLGPLLVVEFAKRFEELSRLVVSDASLDVFGHRVVEGGELSALAGLAITRGVAQRLHAGRVVLAARAEEEKKERSGAHSRTIAQARGTARCACGAGAVHVVGPPDGRPEDALV